MKVVISLEKSKILNTFVLLTIFAREKTLSSRPFNIGRSRSLIKKCLTDKKLTLLSLALSKIKTNLGRAWLLIHLNSWRIRNFLQISSTYPTTVLL